LLDFSQRGELGLHAVVVAEVQAAAAALGIRPLVVGAFARDLHLAYGHNIPVVRQTDDIDLAFAVPDWPAFEQLRVQLLASGRFAETRVANRLRHAAHPVDLVPFGAVEAADRTIAWPPQGEFVMDAFGFQEAQRGAVDMRLPGQMPARVVSLPALALLKLVCWTDRHLRVPRKDAADLQLILAHYLQAGNDHRLWDEFLPWTEDAAFD
jgi:predicted nucleotidyltransferase